MNEVALLPNKDEWSQIKEFAALAVKSGLLPTSIKTAEAAAVIIMKGRELGLPPMVSFAHIVVIQGKPTMSAEIQLAYIYRDHPNAEIEFVENSEERCVIKARRANQKNMTTFTWDLARARKMGLLTKDNWVKQPGTMMKWRCITEMKRTLFAETLLGIDYTPEELGAKINTDGTVEVVDMGPPAATRSIAEVETVPVLAKDRETKDGADPKPSTGPTTSPTPTSGAESLPEKPATPPKFTRLQIQKAIAVAVREAQWTNDGFMGWVKENFKKTTVELTDEEMMEALEYVDGLVQALKQEESPEDGN